MNRYFFDQAGDRRMESQNVQNWAALTRLIKNEAIKIGPEGRPSLPNKGWDVLDIGCHTGGLLKLFDKERKEKSLTGVEPLSRARQMAHSHLPKAKLFEKLCQVQGNSANIVVSHETLYLVPNLIVWVNELKRILRPDGGAFIALGSHGENTAWLRWRKRLEEIYGHTSYIYQPMEILQAGASAGFDMELHRLHPDPQTSIRFSPPENGWGEFLSAQEALDFRQQKYVFTFYPRR